MTFYLDCSLLLSLLLFISTLLVLLIVCFLIYLLIFAWRLPERNCLGHSHPLQRKKF